MNSNKNLTNVKRIFESKTGVDLNYRRPARHSAKTAIVFITAIACCFTMSAFAINYLSDGAMAKFFQRGVLGMEDTHNKLSESQLLTIENYSTSINKSMKSKGTILTIKSVTASISSGTLTAYFVLEMEAPDGALGNIHDSDLTFEDSGFRYERSSENNLSSCGGGSIEVVLDDERGRDNVKTIVYAYHGLNLDFIINKETPITLTFSNLCRWNYIDKAKLPQDGTVKLTDLRSVLVAGDWSFDFDLGTVKESLELMKAPLPLQEHSYTLTSLQISPLCLYLSLDYPELGPTENGIEPPLAFCNDIQIIMGDGTVIQPMRDEQGKPTVPSGSNFMMGGGATIGETRLITSFLFNAPIDLSEADYILFPDGTRIDIP